MAKVRVRALSRAYDGKVRREPGDEFDYDESVQGKGRWYEVLDAPDRAPQSGSKKRASKKFKKHDDLV